METTPGCCAGRPRSRRRVWLAHDQRFLFELPQGLLLFQQFNPIGVRRVRLVHALNELGELTVNGLVPQALRDVRELLTAVRNLALFGQGLGNETARRRIVQLRQERGGRGSSAIRLCGQPRAGGSAVPAGRPASCETVTKRKPRAFSW